MTSFVNDKLVIAKNIKKLLVDIEKISINLPKNGYINQKYLYEIGLDTLNLVYYANSMKLASERISVQRKIIANICTMDFYFERMFTNKYISEKKTLSFISNLELICKQVYKWIESDDKN